MLLLNLTARSLSKPRLEWEAQPVEPDGASMGERGNLLATINGLPRSQRLRFAESLFDIRAEEVVQNNDGDRNAKHSTAATLE